MDVSLNGQTGEIRRVIVNVACNQMHYIMEQQRLLNSLIKVGNRSEYLFWQGTEFLSGRLGACPAHADNPYAFKIYAIEKALELGYNHILWLDASVFAIKETEAIWNIINEQGYLMQNARYIIGNWTNDAALKYFNVSREQAMGMIMYGNAGLLGLNMFNGIAQEFYKRWSQSMLDGMFRGAWKNENQSESADSNCLGHRHDMSCGSIIANQLEMVYQPAHEILEYAPPIQLPINDKIIFKAQGM